MAVICMHFKWLGFRIQDPIQNLDYLQPNLFWTIGNPDKSRFWKVYHLKFGLNGPEFEWPRQNGGHFVKIHLNSEQRSTTIQYWDLQYTQGPDRPFCAYPETRMDSSWLTEEVAVAGGWAEVAVLAEVEVMGRPCYSTTSPISTPRSRDYWIFRSASETKINSFVEILIFFKWSLFTYFRVFVIPNCKVIYSWFSIWLSKGRKSLGLPGWSFESSPRIFFRVRVAGPKPDCTFRRPGLTYPQLWTHPESWNELFVQLVLCLGIILYNLVEMN